MLPLKHEYSTLELAECAGVSQRAVQIQAALESWPAQPRPAQGGGFLFRYEDINERFQKAILAKASGLEPWEFRETNRPLSELENDLKVYGALKPKYQEIARARALVLKLALDYTKNNSLGMKKGREAFSALYRAKAFPGLPPELYGLVRDASVSTLELWGTAFNRGGLAGLAPRSENCGRHSKLTGVATFLIRGALAEKPETRSNHILAILRANLPADEIPHKATVNRWIKAWREKHKAEVAMARNPLEYKNSYQPAFGSLALAPHFGHTWEMDSTPADVVTADGRRCTIMGCIDVYSRKAIVQVVNTSNSLAVASVIREGLLSWGRPEQIKKDNGSEYSSRHIEAVTTVMDIETPKLPAYTPEAKPFIERFFGTLARELEEMLPGFVGHSVAERAAIRARNTWAKKIFERPQDKVKKAVDIPLTQGELMHFIECWLDVYHNRVHQGFASTPGRALKGLTPEQAYAQSKRRPRPIPESKERMLDILLAPVGKRRVVKKGISWQGVYYVAPELVRHMRQDVELRLHPQDAGAIYVFAPGNTFICVASCRALEGQALADYQEEKNREKKRIKGRIRDAWNMAQTLGPDIKYTELLASGRILEGLKSMEAPRIPVFEPQPVIEFNPAFENQATLEMAKAARAYDNPEEPFTLPLTITPVIDFEEARNRVIYPEAKPLDNIDPDSLSGAQSDNPILVFEFFLNKERRDGLFPGQAAYLLNLWDSFSAVQKLHPRPNEETLNIKPPPIDGGTPLKAAALE